VVVVEDAAPQTTQERAEEQATVVIAAETAEEHPAPARARAGGRRRLPRATLWRKKTELRLPRLLKKGESQPHPEQRSLHQGTPLARIRVQ